MGELKAGELKPLPEPVGARYGWTSIVVSLVLLRTLIFFVGVWSVHSITSISQIDLANASGTPWIAFDGGFYLNILLHGYPAGPAVPFQIAYFPLYPLVSKLLMPLMSPAAALLTISNLCSFVGLFVVYGWARSITNARTAYLSAMLLAMYPGAVFYCADLTEAMFMMFVAIVMYLLTEKRMWTAAIVCAVATACRPTAVALSLTVFIWTIFNSRELPLKVQFRKAILIGMISVISGACYQGFIWHRYQRFDAYKVAEDKWDTFAGPVRQPSDERELREVSDEWRASAIVPLIVGRPGSAHPGRAQLPPIPESETRRYSLSFLADRLKTPQAWNRLITVALMIMLVAAVIRRSAVPRLLLLVPLIIFLMSYLPNFGLRASSILRYESAGVPLFVVLAWHLAKPRRQPLLALVMLASLALELYYAFLFSRGSWVG